MAKAKSSDAVAPISDGKMMVAKTIKFSGHHYIPHWDGSGVWLTRTDFTFLTTPSDQKWCGRVFICTVSFGNRV
jgi:hypothetical protein